MPRLSSCHRRALQGYSGFSVWHLGAVGLGLGFRASGFWSDAGLASLRTLKPMRLSVVCCAPYLTKEIIIGSREIPEPDFNFE